LKILVFEYITGGGLVGRDLPSSFVKEGELMLQSLLGELAPLPAVEIWICRDSRLLPLCCDINVKLLAVDESADIWSLFDDATANCDAVLPIAPESGGILENLCTRVQSAGKLLLSSPAAAVRLCGDKRQTLERLRQSGIAAIPAMPLPSRLPPQQRRWVVKAYDGAGCAETFIVGSEEEYRSVKEFLNDPAGYLLQPLVNGKPVSLSCLFDQGQCTVLSYNEQLIVDRGSRFELRGCIVNAPCTAWDSYCRLAGQIAAAFPNLWGYAGIDLLETAAGPCVLEINPRLTTSYAGLSEALQRNVFRYVLDLLQTGLPPTVQRGRPVTVVISGDDADGG
jgi:predicted ATP-grasp superfamily ATP-dependent carboligase